MRHETYIELECVVEGDFTPGSKGVNNPLAGIYEPSTLPEIENPTVYVLVAGKRMELPESDPMWDQIVEEALQNKLQELEDEMYARADYEYDRRKDNA